MTIRPWDIPGYVQGHRFSNDPHYWNEATGRFRDLAGYDGLGGYVEHVAGTPPFALVGPNNRAGLKLDNTSTYKFHTAVPWQGTYLFVMLPVINALGGATFYPWLFGSSSTVTTNGYIKLFMTYVGDTRSGNLQMAPPSGIWNTIQGEMDFDNIGVYAFSYNQAGHSHSKTIDGVNITTVIDPESSSGQDWAIGAQSVPYQPVFLADIGGISNDYVRLGDMYGAGELAPEATAYCYLFEQHFWKYDVLLHYPEKLAALYASLNDYYQA